MTTKFIDDTICTFEIVLLWRFPRRKKKNSVLDDFPLCRQGPPLKKRILFSLSSRRLLGVVSPHLPGEIFPSFSVGLSQF